MLIRLALALLVMLAASAAQAQQRSPQGQRPAQSGQPQLTRHGQWVEGSLNAPGRQGCISGTPSPGRGSLQITIGKGADEVVVLVLAVQMEGATFAADETVRFRVDQRTFEMQGRVPRAGAPVMVVLATTEDEARQISDLLVAMRAGRELRVDVGSRNLNLSLSGAGAALQKMRECAQRANMMPR
ncbi:DUF1176 domain-containing protein [Muricoccus radiodurans]|uniref:DUF1176 domain-containing protein n=1 Tax=Muricoccus radiodurans TaxID=2231721 RepID=UPI003CEABD0D